MRGAMGASDSNLDEKFRVRCTCGAYLLVAFADTKMVDSEEARLIAGLASVPPFSRFDANLFADEYNNLTSDMRADYGVAARKILKDLELAAKDAPLKDLCIHAARAASVADNVLEPQEEAALTQVASALGLAPGEI